MAEKNNGIAEVLKNNQERLLKEWLAEQSQIGLSKLNQQELRTQSADLLSLLMEATSSSTENVTGPAWEPVRKLLSEISKARSIQGFSPTETASFVLSLKRPLFTLMREKFIQNPDSYADNIWIVSALVDKLGLYTTEVYQKTRDELIARQQEEMLELSTPVVKLWDGILALPMIGTLDSSRTQVVMESLLQKIMETGSEIAIIDITGVPTVDTLVAQHLIKTVTAAKLMGAECIISGIRPQIAATIVHLGVDLGGIATKANLADAFMLALSKTGRSLGKATHTREVRA